MQVELPGILTFFGERHFAKALADYLLAHYFTDKAPETFATLRILLPNRRAVVQLQQALFAASGNAPLLLPSLYSLGDLQPHEWLPADALRFPEVFGGIARKAWVSELMHDLMQRKVFAFFEGEKNSFVNATRYAESFLNLRDDCLRAEITTEALANVVPAEYAAHWLDMLSAFQALNQALDTYLASQNRIEPVTYQHLLVRSIVEKWGSHPPKYPIIATGYTADTLSASRLLHRIRQLPGGQVILPGLDLSMSEEAWQTVHVSHPQYHARQWLEAGGLTRADVHCVTVEETQRDRHLSRIMLPAAAMSEMNGAGLTCLPHITLHACADDIAESELCALAIRQALQQGDTGINVVSEDDAFITRLESMLKGWGVSLDRAAGLPAMHQPAYRLLMLSAELAFLPYESHRLLALLRHADSFPSLRSEALNLAGWLDTEALRGWHPFETLQDIARLCQQKQKSTLLQGIVQLLQSRKTTLADYFTLHQRIVQYVTENDSETSRILETFGEFTALLSRQPRVSGAEYIELLTQHFARLRIPRPVPEDARVSVMGALEMRLHQADLVIIPQMNKGIWPRTIPSEPWLNQAMRHRLGLNFAEHQSASAAHDLWMMLKAPKVVLIHAEKRCDAPAQPSRFFERLQWACRVTPAPQLNAWRKLQLLSSPDLPDNIPPSPPVELRMKRLSATAVETLLHNPFEIYVSHICRLRERKPLDAPFGASDLGSVLHRVMESAALHYDASDLTPYFSQLAILFQKALQGYVPPAQAQFYTRRLQRILQGVIHTESSRAHDIADMEAEIPYEAPWITERGTVTVSAKIDRIEYRRDGSMVLIDHKTGTAPGFKDVSEKNRCQLVIAGWLMHTLEKMPYAAMALEYWQLKGATALEDLAKRVDRGSKGATLGWPAVLTRISDALAHYCFDEAADFAWNPAAPHYSSAVDQLARVRK